MPSLPGGDGSMSGPTPGPGNMPGVDPGQLRREVAALLEAAAPSPADRTDNMERAHALLQDALGGDGRDGRGGGRG